MRDKVCIFLQRKCACFCRASSVFCSQNLANHDLIFFSLFNLVEEKADAKV